MFKGTGSLLMVLAFLGPLSGVVVANDEGDYIVGVGIADVTGPAADIGMMGYASLTQKAGGIHFRLFARAFLFQSGEDGVPIVFLSADIGMVDQALKIKVVEKLQEKYGNLFTHQTVLLSGTHTHSGPGAFLQYLMYGITSSGFSQISFDAIVDGMVQSIERAYESRQPGKVFISKGTVKDANINRSLLSYLANPEDERAKYEQDGGQVDTGMTLLRIETADGKPLGSINWFAVHPTSMNNTNTLISGDNKGYASMLFEYQMNPNDRPGKGEFVAAFASANLGDVSPNINGAKCIDTDPPVDCHMYSLCPSDIIEGRNFSQKCIAFGPGTNGDMEESTEIIGRRQFDEAFRLFKNEDNSAEQLKGSIQFVHQFVNMSWHEWPVTDPLTNVTETVQTCPGALGRSFAGGTTDGPGLFDFYQGDGETENKFWDLVRNVLKAPTPELLACQEPKPILLSIGEAHFPYEWVPAVVETQILKIGNLYIIGIPGELTTMAGRRLRETVEAAVTKPGGPKQHVVIGGLSNVYTHYIATIEEYAIQRYEAASTLYGPHTLQAYQHQYKTLAEHLLSGEQLDVGPAPPNLLDRQISLITPIVVDTAPPAKNFGDVLVEPVPEVTIDETIITRFVGGHLRNNAMREGTFLLVEKDEGDGKWKVVATDADWSTKLRWSRPRPLSTESVIEITWKVPPNVEEGVYRIQHFGYYKPKQGADPISYSGMTSTFKVTVPAGKSRLASHPESSLKVKKPSQIPSAAQFWQALASANAM